MRFRDPRRGLLGKVIQQAHRRPALKRIGVLARRVHVAHERFKQHPRRVVRLPRIAHERGDAPIVRGAVDHPAGARLIPRRLIRAVHDLADDHEARIADGDGVLADVPIAGGLLIDGEIGMLCERRAVARVRAVDIDLDAVPLPAEPAAVLHDELGRRGIIQGAEEGGQRLRPEFDESPQRARRFQAVIDHDDPAAELAGRLDRRELSAAHPRGQAVVRVFDLREGRDQLVDLALLLIGRGERRGIERLLVSLRGDARRAEGRARDHRHSRNGAPEHLLRHDRLPFFALFHTDAGNNSVRSKSPE